MATINSGSIGDMYLQIDYTVTQNASNNTSTVRATLKLVNHYALYMSTLGGSYLSVGGQKVDYSKTISYGGSTTTTTTLYGPRDFVIAHKSDGTASCNLTGTFVMNGTYRGYSVGTMSVNQTITLPKIARSSSFTVPASINTGTILSGTITPSSSAFNHKVLLKVGTTLMTTLNVPAGSTTFAQSVGHDWLPSSTSGTITAVLETYNGTTLVASTSKNITANVPSNILPSVSWFGLNGASNDLSGQYVQGKTSATLSTTAQAGSGASIVSYIYSGPGLYTSTTSSSISTGVLQSSGNLTYTVQVTDTRGRTASKTTEFYVNPYSVPSIGPVSVQRCDASGNLSQSGTYARYTVNSSYSTIVGKNTRTITVAYSSNNGSTYSAETTLQAETDTAGTKTGVYGGGTFAAASTYLIRFTIRDAYGATATVTTPLKAAERPMNIKANGKGVGFGKMAEADNLLDCTWNIKSHGVVSTSEYDKLIGFKYLGIVDANTIREPGMYGIYNSTNVPTGDIATLEVVKYSPDWIIQRFTVVGSGTSFTRSWYGATTWSSWTHTLDSNIVKDYVYEVGGSGSWVYRKWYSGIAECWCTVHTSTGVFSGTSPTFYCTPGTRFNYPAGLFTSVSDVQMTVALNGGGVITAFNCSGIDTTYCEPGYIRLYGGSSNLNVSVSIHTIGRWTQ